MSLIKATSESPDSPVTPYGQASVFPRVIDPLITGFSAIFENEFLATTAFEVIKVLMRCPKPLVNLIVIEV